MELLCVFKQEGGLRYGDKTTRCVSWRFVCVCVCVCVWMLAVLINYMILKMRLAIFAAL